MYYESVAHKRQITFIMTVGLNANVVEFLRKLKLERLAYIPVDYVDLKLRVNLS